MIEGSTAPAVLEIPEPAIEVECLESRSGHRVSQTRPVWDWHMNPIGGVEKGVCLHLHTTKIF